LPQRINQIMADQITAISFLIDLVQSSYISTWVFLSWQSNISQIIELFTLFRFTLQGSHENPLWKVCLFCQETLENYMLLKGMLVAPPSSTWKKLCLVTLRLFHFECPEFLYLGVRFQKKGPTDSTIITVELRFFEPPKGTQIWSEK